MFGRKGNPDDVYLVTQHPEEQIVCNTVVEEVAFSLVQRGMNWEDARSVAEEALEKVGISHLMDRDVSTLSDGEKQLVLVSSAIASDAKCLAFDEPFAHLHPAIAGKILKIIREDSRTVVLSEHRLELSDGFDRVHFMGKDVCSGALDVGSDFAVSRVNRINGNGINGGNTIVRARDATVFRGKRKVLEDLNFRVREGEALAVTGVNGAGKTTLLRAIAGLERSKGMEVRGKPFMSFQYPGYTLNSSTVGKEVPLNLLRKFGLESYAERHPHSLSSGERRILASLKALRGKVVLLDEPTAGLDRELRMTFILKLVEEIRETKRCLIVATHDSAVAEVCDFELELTG